MYFDKSRLIAEARAATGYEVHGYTDLPLETISQLTGLSPEAAALAATREYSETLLSGDFHSPAFEHL